MSDVDVEQLIKRAERFVRNNQKTFDELKGNTKEAAEHDIERIRELIDSLDNDIVRKLQARQRAVDIIHIIKEKWDMDIRDIPREDEIKMRLVSKYPEMEETILTLYNHIFD